MSIRDERKLIDQALALLREEARNLFVRELFDGLCERHRRRADTSPGTEKLAAWLRNKDLRATFEQHGPGVQSVKAHEVFEEARAYTVDDDYSWVAKKLEALVEDELGWKSRPHSTTTLNPDYLWVNVVGHTAKPDQRWYILEFS